MSSIYFKCQIIVVLETPITLAISLVVTVIFIFDCDKNKLFKAIWKVYDSKITRTFKNQTK